MCKLGMPLFCGSNPLAQVNPAACYPAGKKPIREIEPDEEWEMLGRVQIPIDRDKNQFAKLMRTWRNQTAWSGFKAK